VTYRLIDPGSEWRLHRQWFVQSAGLPARCRFCAGREGHANRCLDKILAHKDDLINFLRARWGELFGVTFDVLLYDLTNTYFESDTARGEENLRRYGYSRDKRGDCRQVVIGLIVTLEGFPLSYGVLAGNTADSTTLGDLLTRIKTRSPCVQGNGKANRIWCMD